ncbi:DinB family protein [Ktedonospora formicarum]|uniref:DinB-like domain-containing protein n=1 Tax=Ktedonospora formicarum TaxID=2778364 RepID=A0A8J3IFD7_9CHLR|nr:DinB family protein [Ktedonospora formicarum]GHO51333.1 hypothetical protein KSX_94960 [Ktedonospora formicarum]
MSLETTWMSHYIIDTLDQIMACLEGFDEHQLNWRPPVEGGNSLHGLALHVLANTEGDIFGHLRGHSVQRDRKQELATVAPSATSLLQRWQESRKELEDVDAIGQQISE